MTVTTHQIEETAEYVGYQDVDNTTGAVTYRREWKAGSGPANRRVLRDRLIQARDVFRANNTNWPSMTAAQKDAANRQAQRAIANLLGYVLKQTDAGD